MHGNVSIVKQLIDAGAPLNTKDNHVGYTALMTAQFNKNEEIIAIIRSAETMENATAAFDKLSISATPQTLFGGYEYQKTESSKHKTLPMLSTKI